jgi:hypothetical protein
MENADRRGAMKACLIILPAILIFTFTPQKGEEPGSVDPDKVTCTYFDLKTDKALTGKVEETDHKFSYLSDWAATKGGPPYTVINLIRNNKPNLQLSAGWEEAGMPFIEDCGKCRVSAYQSSKVTPKVRHGRIIFGPMKKGKQDAQCYRSSRKPTAGKESKEGKDDEEEQEEKATEGKPLKSRLFVEGREGKETVDIRFRTELTDKKEYLYIIENKGKSALLFSIPSLLNIWTERNEGRRPESNEGWKTAGQGRYVIGPGEKAELRLFSFRGKRAEEEVLTLVVALERDKTTALASGLVSVYVPEK